MPETLDDLMLRRRPSPERPLNGLLVLVVDDSRFTCEALRLMCQRSGARIRRAESLASARRHLSAYRPSVALVDIGLPDGSGLDFVKELAQAEPRINGIVAFSGDPEHEDDAIAAGADLFLEKPIRSLEAFQRMILSHLPEDFGPDTLAGDDEVINPDVLALRDDLTDMADLLRSDGASSRRSYVAAHLQGLGRSAGDEEISRLATMTDVPEMTLAEMIEAKRDTLGLGLA